jgi:hypothetical protein
VQKAPLLGTFGLFTKFTELKAAIAPFFWAVSILYPVLALGSFMIGAPLLTLLSTHRYFPLELSSFVPTC